MSSLSRRKAIAAMLGWPIATMPGCGRGRLPSQGELRHTNFAAGHRIRDRVNERVDLGKLPHVPLIIIGGGVAGLSAGWRLKQSGFSNFLILELEDHVGGTAHSERQGDFAFPWGAHYVPVPSPDNRPLIRLLQEMGVVDRIDEGGKPMVGEQFLCRDPQERVYVGDRWHEGLYPDVDASADDLRQLQEFRKEIDRWVEARDTLGRRMFAVPMSQGSDSQSVRQLDQISMAQWMQDHGWDSPRLNWLVDYGCRDDYGLSIDRVSAWAGVFYFAARIAEAGEESQDVITWPDGNGRIVDHLAEGLGDCVRTGIAVSRIEALNPRHPPVTGPSTSDADTRDENARDENARDENARDENARDGDPRDRAFNGQLAVTAMETRTGKFVGWQADRVIFAAPQMLARHLILNEAGDPVRRQETFQYGSWLVANVHLRDRPAERGFPMCWDNVIQSSRSLGYVTSTHQTGRDHGPTVLTWYHPFADVDAVATRQQMLMLTWSDWAQVVMDDLSLAHPDLDQLVTRLDIKLWGHAMIQPRVGFIWNSQRLDAARPLGSIHFAGTDLSGIALFEEAFHHGLRAAEEVLAALRWDDRPLEKV